LLTQSNNIPFVNFNKWISLEIKNQILPCMTQSLTLPILSMIIIISDIVDSILMNYLIQNLVKELGQVEPDPGEVRPEPENPEEPGPGGDES